MNSYMTMWLNEDKVESICNTQAKEGWRPIVCLNSTIHKPAGKLFVLFERPSAVVDTDKPIQKQKMTAEERMQELLSTSGTKVPPLAKAYLSFLSSKYGYCGEVALTAFAHYAQAIEGLECTDDLYAIGMEGREWFSARK